MQTRCKFRVVGVEDTEGEVKRVSLHVPANTPHPVTGVISRYDVDEYESYDPPKHPQNVRLAAQYDSTKTEDVSFAAATPSGELKIYVSNPVVVGTFKPGQEYYLDLIPCEG